VRLWRQLALVMALLAVVPAVVLGGLAISSVDEEWRRASEARVRKDARRRADELGAWVAASRSVVRELTASFSPSERDAWTPELATGFLSLVYRIVGDARVTALVDARGVPVVPPVSGEETDPSSLLGDLPLRRALQQPDEVHLGRPRASPDGPVVAVTLKVAEGPAGPRFLAVLLAMPVTEAGELQDVGILREDGAALTVSGPLVDPQELAPLLGGVEEFQLAGPEPAHGALATVPGTPGWTVVVVEPERALLRLGRRITGQILIGGLLATLVGLLAAVGTALTVSRPIEQLRAKALQLADGALGVRVGIERNDEIGELATAFDHLSSRLRHDQAHIEAQQAEIEAFNEELQSRVEERTQQLREAQDQLVRTGQLAAVAELGAGLAHDLNNPLTGVLGLAQLLKDRHPDDELIASLEREAQRCRDVVNAMQRATTPEADDARAVPTDVGHIVRRAGEWVAQSFAQRGVSLVIVDPDTPIEARIDPDHGTRILAQVLQSVRSGLPEQSTVTVTVGTHRDEDRPGAPRDRPCIRIEADRRVAEQPQHRDDWLTASRVLWVTVQLVDRLGGILLRPEEGRVWQWVL